MSGPDTAEGDALPAAAPRAVSAPRDVAPGAGLPLGVRVLRALPLRPGAAACALGGALVLATLVWMSAWGVPGSPRFVGIAFLVQRPFWFDAFAGALLASGLWMLERTPRSARRALEELRPRLGPPDVALHAAIDRVVAPAPRVSLAFGVAGALLGVAFTLAIVADLRGRGVTWPAPVFVWIAARNACVFGVLTQCFFQDLRIGRALSRLAGERLALGWSDAAVAAPLARHGLRVFLGWTVVSCAGAFFVIDEAAVRFTLGFIALVLVHALLVGWLALRPAREHVRAAKGAELARLDAEIARMGGELSRGALAAAEGWPRLGAIVAYRGFVASAREWPMDTPALGRLALYLLLPVGSWLGGALMERALGWVLG